MSLFRTVSLLCFFALPALAAAQSAPITVGPGAGCAHATLQAAIDAATDGQTIRIASTSVYLGQTYVITDKSLTLRGGYPDCSTSSTPSGRTTLDANNTASALAVLSGSTTTNRTVILENLRIRRGRNTQGGGVLMNGYPGRLRVELRNVEISNNQAIAGGWLNGVGGGIALLTAGPRQASGAMLLIDNQSTLINNSAHSVGGGLACLDDSASEGVLIRIGSTLVFQNTAASGAGMAFIGCQGVRLHNGGPFVTLLPSGGIVSNTASELGGGLYLGNEAEVEMTAAASGNYGDWADAALISGNSAHSGGGFYVGGGSTLTLIGTRVRHNTATSRGGGGLVQDDGRLTMRELLPTACLPVQTSGGVTTLPPCSTLENNSAGEGGALFVHDSLLATVRNTYLQNNSATAVGSVLFLLGSTADAALTLESALVTGNSGHYPFITEADNGHRAQLIVNASTLADNPPAAFALVRNIAATPGSIAQTSLRNGIAHHAASQPVVSRFGNGTHVVSADCLIASPPLASSGLQTELTRGYSAIAPGFVDAAGGNYRLQQNSPAIDYCDGEYPPSVNHDLDGKPRNQLWTGPAPIAASGRIPGGRYDLGAFEAQVPSSPGNGIFSDGFED